MYEQEYPGFDNENIQPLFPFSMVLTLGELQALMRWVPAFALCYDKQVGIRTHEQCAHLALMIHEAILRLDRMSNRYVPAGTFEICRLRDIQLLHMVAHVIGRTIMLQQPRTVEVPEPTPVETAPHSESQLEFMLSQLQNMEKEQMS